MSKLEVNNNWHHLTYYIDGNKLDETADGEATVRMPDGTERVLPFWSVQRTVRYSDHGHDCEAVSCDLLGQATLEGYVVEIDLRTVDVVEVRQPVTHPDDLAQGSRIRQEMVRRSRYAQYKENIKRRGGIYVGDEVL